MRIAHLTLAALVTILLAAAPAAADAPRSPGVGERIINGHAPTQARPAQVSVFLLPSNSVCGGTLVSARWVLTAGHCATTSAGVVLDPAAVAVNIGGTTRFNGTPRAVDTVLLDPAFTPEGPGPPKNDLALLHLAAPATQEPLRMIRDAETALWSPGVQAKVIGWGVTQTGSQSTTLLEAEVPIVSDVDCSSVWGSLFEAASMVCAGGGSTDTCGGDSGGPLMVAHNGAFTLAGVTSWGAENCGTINRPGVYTRLGAPALAAWVRTRVPTVTITASPASPAPGEQVGLSASVARGAQTNPPTSIDWDLDDDGAFDDATGDATTTSFPAAGTRSVRVRATFADGDRAGTRDPIVVAGPAPPPPPPPPPPAPAPAPGPTPEQLAAAVAAQRAVPIGSITAPATIKLAALRGAKSLRVPFNCRLACTISGRLTITASNAKRYRLPVRTIATGNASLSAAGNGVMTVRITARAKRELRRAKTFTATLATTLSGDDAASVPGTKKVTVRR